MHTNVLFIFALNACSPKSPIDDTASTSLWNKAPVEVHIDEQGIPHLFAASDRDLFHAAGYRMAVDRLYQSEMLRRFAHGRLSEVLGEAGIDRDRQVRIFDIPRWGRADMVWMQENDPERAELLRAWVAGINRRVDEILDGNAPLPYGFGPDELDFVPSRWDDADPYIVLQGANFALDKTLEFDITISLLERLYPFAMDNIDVLRPAMPVYVLPDDERPAASSMSTPEGDAHALALDALDPDLIRALTAFRRPSGSNNWAIDGAHTASGRPLLAGDPHLGFDFFGAPYPIHLNSKDAGGTYNVAGFAFPGTPGIALGQTDSAVWAATSAFADVMDVFDVERTEDGVLFGDEEVLIEEREETIIVRLPGGPAGEGIEVTTIYEDLGGRGLLLPQSFLPLPLGDYVVTWTGFEAKRAAWFMELNRVDSLDSFEDAVGRMTEMNFNLVAATAEGIAYKVGIDVPDRGTIGGANTPWRVMDGTDSNLWWSGAMLTEAQRPSTRAENRGWLATANNDPFGFTDDGRLDNDPWYYGSLFDPGYRAARLRDEIVALIEAGPATLEDMQILQMDTHSTLADHLVPLLIEAHQRVMDDADASADPDVTALVSLFEGWDHRMDMDSAGALAFQAYLHQLGSQVLADDFGLAYEYTLELQAIYILKFVDLTVRLEYATDHLLQAGRDTEMLTAAARTAAWLVEQFGVIDTEAFALDDMKVTRFDHSLGFGLPLFDRPSAGGEDTICVAQNIATPFDGSVWSSSYVSVERTIAEIAADGVPDLWVNYPFAATADPDSPETSATMDDYIEGAYRRLWFRSAEVAEHTVSSTILPPSD